jgi:hypothetical protein
MKTIHGMKMFKNIGTMFMRILCPGEKTDFGLCKRSIKGLVISGSILGTSKADESLRSETRVVNSPKSGHTKDLATPGFQVRLLRVSLSQLWVSAMASTMF